MRIIWIDDDLYRNEKTIELLELFDLEIDFFTKYEEGLNHLKTHLGRIDAMILDIMMNAGDLFTAEESEDGRITGLLLYKRIRKIYQGPILFYTVLRDEAIILDYISNDSQARYLKKPADEQEIISKITEMRMGIVL